MPVLPVRGSGKRGVLGLSEFPGRARPSGRRNPRRPGAAVSPNIICDIEGFGELALILSHGDAEPMASSARVVKRVGFNVPPGEPFTVAPDP